MAMLVEVAKVLSSSLDFGSTSQAIIDHATRLIDLDTGAFYRIEGEMLELAAAMPELSADLPEVFRRTPVADHPLICRCLKTGSPLVFDGDREQLAPAEREIYEKGGLGSVLYVPLIAADEAIGVLIVSTVGRTREFPAFELDLYQTLAAQAALAAVNARLFDEARESIGELREQIAKREALEAQLRVSERRELAGRFAGGVAHDFNNLLTAVIGNATYIADELGDDHPLAEDLDEIIAASVRGSELTRQLLAFGRKQVLSPRTVDLCAIVRGLEKMFSRLISADIAIDVDCGGGAVFAEADVGQIEQVIINLVVNARDAMPEGGALALRTSAEDVAVDDPRRPVEVPAGSYAVLTVRDTGAGMDEATRLRIFEPFYSTKAEGVGAGLGLATSEGIVAQSGGYVTVDSEVGLGSTFRVWLPRVAQEDVVIEERATPSRSRGGEETILVVDDEEIVRRVVGRGLQRTGYTVHSVASPEAAVEIAREVSIDLLITDVVMPQQNGPELAKTLAAMRPQMRTIFMSGYVGEAVLRRGLQGDDHFIAKPFTVGELVAKIRMVLDES